MLQALSWQIGATGQEVRRAINHLFHSSTGLAAQESRSTPRVSFSRVPMPEKRVVM
jgi:hypothetical protein